MNNNFQLNNMNSMNNRFQSNENLFMKFMARALKQRVIKSKPTK